MTEPQILNFINSILPLIIIIIAFFIGIVFDRIIRLKLTKIAEQTKWKGDEIIVKALHRMPVLWFSLTGIYAATYYIDRADHFIKKLLNIPHNLLVAIIILSVTIFCSKVAVGFVKLYVEKVKNILPTTSIFANLTKILIFLIGALIIMQTLGISIMPILTTLGVGGLAISLALQDTLSNLFSGLHLILSQQIKPGDYVKLNTGEEGYVADITWRNTTLRQLQNNMVVIPNSKLASTIVVNYYLPDNSTR